MEGTVASCAAKDGIRQCPDEMEQGHPQQMNRPAVIAFTGLLAACLLAGSLVTPSVGQGFGESSTSKEYQAARFTDPVSRLNKRLASGEARLEWYERHGFLRAVLRELDISPASQTLVFSKTSLQRGFISPRRRARSISTIRRMSPGYRTPRFWRSPQRTRAGAGPFTPSSRMSRIRPTRQTARASPARPSTARAAISRR
jgi:hypothetical protein